MIRDKAGRFTSDPRPEKKTGKIVNCAYCQKEFYLPKNRLVKIGSFCCSLSCSAKFRMQDLIFREKVHSSTRGKIQWNKNKKLPRYSGVNHPQWRGGRLRHGDGYILIYIPEHPLNCKGYVLEHRLVIENHIGRYLTRGETVHHINGIKDDNRVENLQVLSNSEHLKLEWENASNNGFSNSKKTWFPKGLVPWNKKYA
mgnify:CR=1 FL=1